MMRQIKRTILVAAAAFVLAAATAQAGEVILVAGDHAVRVNDPAVPSKAEIALVAPPGARHSGVAAAAVAPPPRGAPIAAPSTAPCARARWTGQTRGAGGAGT